MPSRANGQLAAAAYHRGPDGACHAFAIVVLATTRTHVTRITLFGDPGLFERFGLPLAQHPGHSQVADPPAAAEPADKGTQQAGRRQCPCKRQQ